MSAGSKKNSSPNISRKSKQSISAAALRRALDDPLFEEVLSLVEPHLAPKGGEFTVEANPENLTEAKLAIMRKHGVNRLSIGVESSQDKFLALMGRKHTFEQARWRWG
jgi:oxygen-independent coproporphyrinogen-3 oxidase